MVHWFTYDDENVEGPFTTEDIKRMGQSGELEHSTLVWGKPLVHWKSYSYWMSNLESLLQQADKMTDNRLWHYAINGESHGPMSRKHLIEALQFLQGDCNDALIWTKGMEAWAPIFEFHDLMDAIGVNRRKYPRAPVNGTVIVHVGEQKVIGQLKAISEGGFGATALNLLSTGMQVNVEIQSDAFPSTIHASVQVRYISEEGFIGFKFGSINRESQAQIINYVKETISAISSQLKVA